MSKDLVGQTFGMLNVINTAPPRLVTNKFRIRYEVECDCGTKKIVFADNLIAGRTKSCGCKQGYHVHQWVHLKPKLQRMVQIFLSKRRKATTSDLKFYIFDKYLDISLEDKNFARHFLVWMERKNHIVRDGMEQEPSGQWAIVWKLKL